MANHRVLTDEQVSEGIWLKDRLGFSKMALARKYNVSSYAIWFNIFVPVSKKREIYLTRSLSRVSPPEYQHTCSDCGIGLTDNISDKRVSILNQINGELIPEDRRIPTAYKMGDKCISCYLREMGIQFTDLYITR